MNPLDVLDRPIAFHRVFVEMTGSVTAALFLSQVIYWSRRTKDPDGWFYKSAVDWQKEIGLTRHEQITARKALAAVLEEKLAGMPAVTHFRVTGEKLRQYLVNNGSASCTDSVQHDVRIPPNMLYGKRQSTNISVITTEERLPTRARKTRDAVGLDFIVNKSESAAQAERIAQIFHRRKNTPWSEKEVATWKKLTKNGPLDEAELAMVERYYVQNRRKSDNICRRDLVTFITNYHGEVDRARAWCEKHPAPGAKKPKPKEPEPVLTADDPLPDPNEPTTRAFLDNYALHHDGNLPFGYARDGDSIVFADGQAK